MSKKKKRQGAPNWAVYDNPMSNYGFIYCDLLKSKQFQQLTAAPKAFLLTCFVSARDPKNYGCLIKHYQEKNRALNPDDGYAIYADDSMLKDWRQGYFVFSSKQLAEYGYSSQQACNYFRVLEQAGFIDKVEANQIRMKVNVYRFSTRWKNKTC